VLPEISNSVAVDIPVLLIADTVIFGLPDNPKEVVAKDAVDAVPVSAPTKLDAVTTPVTLIPPAPVIA
jgi:hypothetical protein